MHKIVFVLIALLPLSVYAQRTVQNIDGPRGRIGFYQFLPPSYTAKGEKHPLIIFLHGIGEKGTGSAVDLEKINCCGVPKYINLGHPMEFTWNGKTEGFVVLYPQLYSRYGTWENYYVDAMLEFAKKNLNIDTNRIFLTGLSLGGGATWVYASSSVKKAKQFAGIVPVVSPCFMTNGCNIAQANLPVLAIHALDDNLANPRCTLNALKSINDCDPIAKPNILMYENGGHYVWTKRAYDTSYKYFNPNTYEWMLAQNRTFKPNIKPIAVAGKDTTISSASGRIVLDGTASSDPDGKVVRYVWQKVKGPSYGNINYDVTAHPIISGLTFPGVYTYMLRVIDDRAEWTTATIKITVIDGNVIN